MKVVFYKTMLTELQRASIAANNQEALKAKYRNIMWAKYALYFVSLFIFFAVGLFFGGNIVGQDASRQLNSGMLQTTDLADVENWKSIYNCAIIFLVLVTVALTHWIQRKLSAASHKNNRRLAWGDWCFSCLNAVIFFYGLVIISVGSTLDMSLNNIP